MYNVSVSPKSVAIESGGSFDLVLYNLGLYRLLIMAGGENVEHSSSWIIHRNTGSFGEVRKISSYDYATGTFNVSVTLNNPENKLVISNSGANGATVWYILDLILKR